MQPLTFFLNPAARKVSTLALAPKIEAWAKAASVDVALVSPGLEELPTTLATCLDQGRIPVAVGGDGTVHQLVQHLPEQSLFATLPMGSGNDFASAVGWATNFDEALKQLSTARPVALDAISVEQGGERVFLTLSIAGWGFACDVNIQANASNVPGPLQYPVGVYQALAKGGTRPVRLTFDSGDVVEGRFWTVLPCNTSTAGGGMKFSPHANPQDGTMEVLALGDVSTLGLTALLGRVYFGRHLSHPQVHLWTCQSVTLEPLDEAEGAWSPVQAEGDVYPGAASTTFRAIPGGLRTLVPAASSLA